MKKKENRSDIFTAIALIAIAAVAVALLIFLLSSSGNSKDSLINKDSEEKSPMEEEEYVPEKPYDEVKPLLDFTYTAIAGSKTYLENGERFDGEVALMFEKGRMYASLEKCAKVLGAVVEPLGETGIITVKINKCTSYFSPLYNVIVFNDEPIILSSKPVVEDGEIFLPVSALAKIMNVSYAMDYDNGIAVIGNVGELEKSDYKSILTYLGIEFKRRNRSAEIDALCNENNRTDVYRYARQERLYVTDDSGNIEKWILLDDFSVEKKSVGALEKYPPNKAFYAGVNQSKEKLYSLETKEYYDILPENSAKNNMVFAVEKYIHEKMKGESADFIDSLKKAVSGENGEMFNEYKQKCVSNGEYDRVISFKKQMNEQYKAAWEELCKNAIPGDIILFRNNDSDSKYGYFNHCAIVLDSDAEAGKLHLLQARSMELGVGADKEMDTVNYDTFFTEQYWKNYDKVVLCRHKDVDEDTSRTIADRAYEKFNGYDFGYGGFFGERQTTCAEMVRIAYDDAGYELIKTSDYIHRLKKIIDGEELSVFLIPDDVVLSEKTDVIFCIFE